MDPVTRHYDNLLSAHYSWMTGVPLADKVAEQQALLVDLGVVAGCDEIAVDLDCGPGYQSLALAKLGYGTVRSIDTSRQLLAELEAANERYPIQSILDDLREFAKFVERQSASVIVCMGDTLTHLKATLKFQNSSATRMMCLNLAVALF